jgi:RNA-directed DNA polymerase
MSYEAWEAIDWNMTIKKVSRLQQRIYKASKENNLDKVQQLQRKLIFSLDSRLLSVKKVNDLNTSNTKCGVNYCRILKNQDKFKLAKSLSLNEKLPQIKKIFLPKSDKAVVHDIRDQCKQILVKLALEPEWEAKFENNSYGLRPGRSYYDAVKAIIIQFYGESKFVINTSIEKSFNHINQEKLINKLNTFPLIKNQILLWLKNSIINENNNTKIDTHLEIFHSGIISGLLVNIILHGLEKDLKSYYANNIYDCTHKVTIQECMKQVGFARYVDFFIITANTYEVCEKLQVYTSKWLYNNTGLRLTKTKIIHSSQGFDFLGFNLISLKIKNKIVLKVHPSRASKKNFIARIRFVISKNKSLSAGQLIILLNPIINCWCNYFKYSQCLKDFKQVEYAIFGMIRAWVFRRKSKGLRSKFKLKEKYFPENTTVIFNNKPHNGNWILKGLVIDKNNEKKEVFLIRPSWIKVQDI